MSQNCFFFLVSPITNGISKESEDLASSPDYYIKCPQCQKGCQTFQALKEHMETSHSDLIPPLENGVLGCSTPVNGLTPGASVSPSLSLVSSEGPFGCSQCTTSFTTKDQLEKHELLHSPNAQVVSSIGSMSCTCYAPLCKLREIQIFKASRWSNPENFVSNYSPINPGQ